MKGELCVWVSCAVVEEMCDQVGGFLSYILLLCYYIVQSVEKFVVYCSSIKLELAYYVSDCGYFISRKECACCWTIVIRVLLP